MTAAAASNWGMWGGSGASGRPGAAVAGCRLLCSTCERVGRDRRAQDMPDAGLYIYVPSGGIESLDLGQLGGQLLDIIRNNLDRRQVLNS